jgi:hypothetical protein
MPGRRRLARLAIAIATLGLWQPRAALRHVRRGGPHGQRPEHNLRPQRLLRRGRRQVHRLDAFRILHGRVHGIAHIPVDPPKDDPSTRSSAHTPNRGVTLQRSCERDTLLRGTVQYGSKFGQQIAPNAASWRSTALSCAQLRRHPCRSLQSRVSADCRS